MRLNKNRYKSTKIGAVALLCLGILVFGCGKSSKTSRYKVFRYNEHANISSLDPAFAKNQNNIWAVNQIFNGLTQLDDSLNAVPDIAKRWVISKDATQYEFVLRSDVFFHKHRAFGRDSTRNVVASDVVYSLNRLLDKNIASSGRWVMDYLQSVVAVNDTILRIRLNRPFPGFLGLLATKYCSVVPKEVVNLLGTGFGRQPIGTGPFKFKFWKEHVKLVLRRNPDYYEFDSKGNRLPYIEAVSVTFLPDKQAEFLNFLKDDLDFLNSIDASYKDDLITSDGTLREAYQGKINMQTSNYLNTEYLGLLMDGGSDELKSKQFRKALNYAFDRQKIIDYLRNGIGTPAVYGMIPRGMPGSGEKPVYRYDLHKAKTMIETYIKETRKPPQITISTTSNYVDICEYLQSEFEKIGVKTNVSVLIASTLKQSKATGKLDIFRSSWIADYPDSESYMSLFYSKNAAPEGPNYTHYKNTTFDSIYNIAIRETNTAKRNCLYRSLDSLVMEDAPVIPLYYDKVVRFVNPRVKGLTNNTINLLVLKRVKIEDK